MGRYEDLKFFVAPNFVWRRDEGNPLNGLPLRFRTNKVLAHFKLEFAYAKRIDLYSERND